MIAPLKGFELANSREISMTAVNSASNQHSSPGALPAFFKARVLVVGDVMLDQYWHGKAERISPEAPVPVVRISGNEDRPGGAANVALNVAALGAATTLAGITGDDEAGRTLAGRLAAQGRDAAIAASGGQAHYLTGLWSRHLLEDLEQALDQRPRLQDWAKRCGAAIVEWPATPYDPFFNVNTPEELAEAERIAAEFRA